MPILQVKLSAAPSAELSQQVASALVDITAHTLHKRPAVTVVTLDYVAPAQWFVEAKSLVAHNRASFFLDIEITDGINTKDEKAAFQQQVFARMGELLGPLHPVSYIHIEDVKGDAWGYGGLTQEFRYIQRQIPGAVAVDGL